jgi:hypothetical protein
MRLDEAFTPTPDEQARLQTAPFRGTDESGWAQFAAAMHEQLVAAYAQGEITLERALQVVLSCSIGCRVADRVTLFTWTARRALAQPPPSRKKHQANPTWVRNSAANLLDMLREDRAGEPFAPNEMNGWTTPILEDAIKWLTTLGLCEPVSARTLYSWWLDARQKKDTQSNPTLTA